jgi:hypothetical protein
MAAGDPQRVWFPEMIEKLRAEWRPEMSFESLIELRDALDCMLHRIREAGGIRTPIITCRSCGYTGPAGEPRVSVRSMILSLQRFGIAGPDQTKTLDRGWASYRKKHQLDLFGKVSEKNAAAESCGHPNLR